MVMVTVTMAILTIMATVITDIGIDTIAVTGTIIIGAGDGTKDGKPMGHSSSPLAKSSI